MPEPESPRKEGESFVVLSVLVLLLIGLGASTYIFYRKLAAAQGELKAARFDALKATVKDLMVDRDFGRYLKVVGWQADEAEEEFAKLKEKLEQAAPLPAAPEAEEPAPITTLAALVEAYAARCAALERQNAELKKELAEARKAGKAE